MRKAGVCAQMITLGLLLTACGKGGGAGADEAALDIRAKYIALTGCAGQMEVTADYGQRVYTYEIDFTYGQEEGLVLTVTAPENVAGVTARITDGKTSLEFDGVSVETGPLSGDGLSPIEGLPALLKYAREGCIAESGFETLEGDRQTVRMVCRNPDEKPGKGMEASLWFDRDTHELVKGEISSDGYTVLRCDFIAFTLVTTT